MDDTPRESARQGAFEADVEEAHPLEQLGQLIRAKRYTEDLTLEQAAQQSGISAATLSRLERQGKVSSNGVVRGLSPDTRTLAAITRWLGVSFDTLMNSGTPKSGQTLASRGRSATPDIVEAHLRADRNLNSETAEALANMFRVAYEQFSRFSNGKPDGGETLSESEDDSTVEEDERI